MVLIPSKCNIDTDTDKCLYMYHDTVDLIIIFLS